MGNLDLSFFNSQFSCCPLAWMFQNRELNTKINNLQHWALCILYQDETSTFEECFLKDESITVHHKNIC